MDGRHLYQTDRIIRDENERQMGCMASEAIIAEFGAILLCNRMQIRAQDTINNRLMTGKGGICIIVW